MKYIYPIALSLLIAFAGQSALAQYSIEKSAFSNGSTSIGDASNTIRGTVGQAMVTRIYNSDNDIHSGFWWMGAIPDIIYSHDFEGTGGSTPTGWVDNDYVNGSVDWIMKEGGNTAPNNPHSGNYNMLFTWGTTDGYTSKLITPELDFSGSTVSPALKFWHAMVANGSDIDELRIYYKTSAAGSWNLLETYTSEVSDWTLRTIDLPNVNSTYYIAFEGKALNGQGVCIDDVTISGIDPTCYTDLYLENVTYQSTERTTHRATNNIYVSNTGGNFTISGNGTNGGRVALTAGSQILLKPGFHAEAGSKFIAKIEGSPCEYEVIFDRTGSKMFVEERIEKMPEFPDFMSRSNVISVWPNPATDKINIRFAKKFDFVEIRNLIGEKVISFKKPDLEIFGIDLHSEPAGIYIIVAGGNAGTITKKFIKN